MRDHQIFFSLCRKIGAKAPLWVQGAGGNVSQKLDQAGQKILRIKASGYRLDQVTKEQGFVDLDYADTSKKIDNLFQSADGEDQYAALLASGVVGRAKAHDRASMETGFHLVIDAPLVAHFHSLAALLLADLYFKNDPKAKKFAQDIKNIKLCFIDYVKPGLDLSFAIKSAPAADAYILRNHGVILALDHEQDFDRWIRLEEAMFKAFDWQHLLKDPPQRDGYWPLAALMPDTIVFMDKLLKVLEEDRRRPGYYRLIQEKIDPNLYELWLANILLLSTEVGVHPIPDSEWEAVSGMPVEKYRRSLQNDSKGN
jgi:rhamnose utilization protein RhaD (predicted bifunctional aldolase and dehydrogenase)